MILVYCFEHGEMVQLEQGGLCEGHTFVLYHDPEIGLSSLDFHCMTAEDYAFCPPPPALFSEELDRKLYDAFTEWCEENEPSSNEVLISNLHANDLKADFKGAL